MQILSILLATVALQGGVQTSQTPVEKVPSIRIYNAAHSDKEVKLDIMLDDAAVGTAVGSDVLSGPFKPKDATKGAMLTVKKAGDANGLVQKQVEIGGKDHVLVLIGDPEQKLDVADLAVDPVPETDQQGHLAVLNAIPDSVDVYVVKAGDTIEKAEPSAKGVATSAGSAIVLPPGSYKIVLTKGDSKTPVSESEPFDAKAANRKAVIAVPGPTGQPPKVVVVDLAE